MRKRECNSPSVFEPAVERANFRSVVMCASAQLMRTARAIRSGVRLDAALQFVVACLVVLNAGPLFASCGDYLFRNGKPVSGHSMAKPAGEAEVSEHPAPQRDAIPRCSGPNCSSRPMSHLPVSQVPIAPVRGMRADCILNSPHEQPGIRSISGIPRSEQGAYFEPLPIFRPPTA